MVGGSLRAGKTTDEPAIAGGERLLGSSELGETEESSELRFPAFELGDPLILTRNPLFQTLDLRVHPQQNLKPVS